MFLLLLLIISPTAVAQQRSPITNVNIQSAVLDWTTSPTTTTTKYGDIASWNVAAVTSTGSMFRGATTFNQQVARTPMAWILPVR